MLKHSHLFKTLFLLLAVVAGGNAWAETVTIWSEDFSGYSADDVPSGTITLPHTGTTLHANGTLTYACANGNGTSPSATKVWAEKLAGGTSPELLVGKYGKSGNTGGKFTATVPLNNIEGTLTLKFNTNKQKLHVYSTTTGVSGEYDATPAAAGQQTATFTGITSDMTSITLVFQAYSSNVRLDNIILEGTSTAPSYTITAISNNDAWGTVSGTTTITASPKDGYKVVADDGGYTVTSGTATVTNNGDNTFSVSASSDCTVRINFEAIPTHTLSYSISPVAAAGTVTLSSSSVREGSTATATAAANAGYKFTSWSISGTGATLSSTSDNPTTVTMGTADATVTANFTAVTTYPVHWSVNGNEVKTDNVEENTAIEFPTAIGGVPAGYTLTGWVAAANKIDTPTDTDPKANYVKSANATAEVTYYAVMALVGTSDANGELANSDITSTFEDHAYGDAEESAIVDDVTWTFRGNRGGANPWIQIRSDATPSYVKVGVDGYINSVKLQISNASNSSGGVNDISKHGDFSGTVYLESSYQSSPSGELASSTVPASAKEVTLNITNSKSSEICIQTSGPARIWNIVAYYTSNVYSGFCTSVPDASVTVSAASYATFCDLVARDFSASKITVYTAKSIGTSVQLTEVTDGIVPANTGVILYKDGGTGTAKNIPAAVTAKTTLADNELIGVNEVTNVAYAGEGSKKNFILSKESAGVGFYKAAAEGANLAAHRAYLSTENVAAAREFLGFTDDETTGIETVNNVQCSMFNGQCFDLQGRRVAQPTKGLYIVNGRKVVIK